MFVICNKCNSKLPIVVTKWNIIPVIHHENIDDSHIHLGMFREVSINPKVVYKILPQPDIYRCRNCGYEKQYPSEEIIFD